MLKVADMEEVKEVQEGVQEGRSHLSISELSWRKKYFQK
jgi:hypothetical protein